MYKVGILLPGVLTFRNAGLTGSALARARALGECGVDGHLLVHVWQPSLFKEVAKCVESGRIDLATTSVANLFEDVAIMGRSGLDTRRISMEKLLTPHGFVNSVPDLTIHEGEPVEVRARWSSDKGTIDSVELLNSGVPISCAFSGADGLLARVQLMAENGTIENDIYFDSNGEVCLVYGDSLDRGRGYTYFDAQGTPEWVGNKEDLIAFWITNFHSIPRFSAVISEFAPHARHIASVNKVRESTGCKSIFALHSNHYEAPFTAGSKIKPTLLPMLRSISEMDSLIVLTEQQRFDIVAQFGNEDKVVLLPHAFEDSRAETSDRRDPNLAVILGRVDPGKGQVDLVKAVAGQRSQWSGKTIEIWGSGSLVDKVESLIQDLDVGDIVKYMGFTERPDSVYGRAAVALFPNHQEAQPLSIIEAMSVGAVPVSYDFKYGPRAMIRDGVDGIIVGVDNSEELLEYSKMLMSNDSLRSSFSTAAINSSRNRTISDLGSDWISLLDRLKASTILRVSDFGR